ncbi:hypothetical protein ABIE69_002864 [Rhodobacteraceae bacterium MBR-64]
MTHPIRLIAASLVIGLAAMPVTAAPTAQKGTVAADTSACHFASDTNAIIFSREDLDCTHASATFDAIELIYLAPMGQRAETEGKCYPSGLCDGEDYSKPQDDYS